MAKRSIQFITNIYSAIRDFNREMKRINSMVGFENHNLYEGTVKSNRKPKSKLPKPIVEWSGQKTRS